MGEAKDGAGVVTAVQALEGGPGSFSGEETGGKGFGDPGFGVPDADLLQRLVEPPAVGRAAKPSSVRLGDTTGGDHLVDAFEDLPGAGLTRVPTRGAVHAGLFYRYSLSLSSHTVIASPGRILAEVPKLWNQTIESHRRDVREAIIDAAGALVAEHGLLAVTMSRIAERTGIGRATLYKYFRDVEAILLAWHERQISEHLERLARFRDRGGSAVEQLQGVLEAYAVICHGSRGRHDGELAALLHRDEQVVRAEHRLCEMIRDLVAAAAEAGAVRDDVAPDELASYCLHALTAASRLPSEAAVRRLVAVTLEGMRAPGPE